MKKLIYRSLFLALLGIVIVSCNEEEFLQPTLHSQENKNTNVREPIQISSDGIKLKFLTSEDYERFINSDIEEINNETLDEHNLKREENPKLNNKLEISHQNYTSYSDYITQNNLENLIGDEMLSEILNQDQIVQIGDFLYKLNLVEEKVYVLPANHDSQYSDLVNENVNNKNIQVFSTSDEVIEMVENGITDQNKLFCRSRRANYKSKLTKTKVINSYANVTAKSQYLKYGILFKLHADVFVYDTDSYSDLRVYIAFENCSYKQRCGSSLTNYNHPWRVPSIIQINTLTRLYRVRLYNSLRKLENYTWKIRGRVEDWKYPVAPNPWNNPYTVVFSDWAEIEDY